MQSKKINGELWYSKKISRLQSDRFLIFILVRHHMTFLNELDIATSNFLQRHFYIIKFHRSHLSPIVMKLCFCQFLIKLILDCIGLWCILLDVVSGRSSGVRLCIGRHSLLSKLRQRLDHFITQLTHFTLCITVTSHLFICYSCLVWHTAATNLKCSGISLNTESQCWDCRGGGVKPPVHVYRCPFLSENHRF